MRKAFVMAAVAGLIFCGMAFAQEAKTIKGEVIDVSCYVTAMGTGPDHKTCALACLQAGEPGGILEEGTGKVYVVITADHSSPAAKIIPYVAKNVEVTGTVIEKGGVSTIEIKEIKEAVPGPMTMRSARR